MTTTGSWRQLLLLFAKLIGDLLVPSNLSSFQGFARSRLRSVLRSSAEAEQLFGDATAVDWTKRPAQYLQGAAPSRLSNLHPAMLARG